jgi:ATP-dependent helicase/DNAse subunit B
VNKLLKNDLRLIQQSQKTNELLSLIDLERSLTTSITIPVKGIETTIYLKGSADRIDKLGNKIRIIDYKSSVKDTDKFKFSNFDVLFTDSQYNKMLQLFMYAWLVVKNNLAKPDELQPCIIPFKKFEEQPKFIMEDAKGGGILNFTTELLQEFENHLKQKISQIIVSSEPFSQTDDEDKCEYCAYASICNVS